MVFEKSRFSQGQDNLHDHKNPGIIKLDKNVKIRYVTETQQSSSSKVVEDDNDQHKFKSVSMDEKNKINIAHTFQKRDNNNSKKMQNLIAGIKQIGVKQSINKAINQTKSVSELNILDNEFRRNQGQVQGSEGHNSQKNKAEQLNMGAVMANGGLKHSFKGLQMNIKDIKSEQQIKQIKNKDKLISLMKNNVAFSKNKHQLLQPPERISDRQSRKSKDLNAQNDYDSQKTGGSGSQQRHASIESQKHMNSSAQGQNINSFQRQSINGAKIKQIIRIQ